MEVGPIPSGYTLRAAVCGATDLLKDAIEVQGGEAYEIVVTVAPSQN